MEKKKGDFILENKGLCFLCSHCVSSKAPSSKISQNRQKPKETNHSLSVSTYSFQHLAHYLQIDIGKVFSGDGPIPPHLLARVQRSKLKVELCAECASVNQHFSELYQKLEKITMEVGTLLRVIMRKLENVEEKDNRIDANEDGQMTTELDMLINHKAEVVKTMRKETKHKCYSKLTILSTPRIRVHNFSVKEIAGEIDKVKRESRMGKQPSSRANSGQITDSESEPVLVALIKTEAEDFNGSDPDYFDPISNTDSISDVDESNYLLERDIDQIENDRTPPFQQSKQTNVNGKSFDWRETYILDVKTDTHKCGDCSMKFVSFPAFYHHYNREHLKLRHNCSACNKSFSQVSSLNRHQQVVHKSLKFKCTACNQLFSLESHLAKHRKADICKPKEMFEKSKSSLIILRPSKRPKDVQKLLENSWDPQSLTHKCGICTQEFEKKNCLTIHLRSAHSKIRFKCGLCQAIFNSRSSYRDHHLKVHVGLKFPCPKCQKVFIYENSLSYHLQRARDCNVEKVKKTKKEKKPLSKTEMEVRKALIIIRHEEISKFRCSICSKEYSTNGSFVKHYMKAHLNIKQKCHSCERVFSSNHARNEHHKKVHQKLTHTCLKCNRIFSWKSALWSHKNKYKNCVKKK